ncbi:hypothetical protein SH611_18205 [Geminicoccaceae bacterium 1502E]|nr:hypothetical protein [Geminicoccaceae bacterium 1502E]
MFFAVGLRRAAPVLLAVSMLAACSGGVGAAPTATTAHPDIAARLEAWREGAARGDAAAQHNMGVAALRGYGMAADPAEAARWFRLAAEQGRASARYNLALQYLRGTGASRSRVKATGQLAPVLEALPENSPTRPRLEKLRAANSRRPGGPPPVAASPRAGPAALLPNSARG